MRKLLKYEFRKSWSVKLMALGIFGVLEAAFLLGLALDIDRGQNVLTLSVLLLVLAAMVVPMAIGVASVVALHRDMNSKQGYMLFMTPRSCYQILGAKVIENGVSIFLSGAAIAALGALDIYLLLAKFGEIERFWEMIEPILKSFNVEINGPVLIAFFFSFLCSWLCEVTMAFFADILASSLLRGRKYSGLVAFLFFIVLSFAVQRVGSLINADLIRDNASRFVAEGGFSLACAIGLYFGAAAVMERNLNV